MKRFLVLVIGFVLIFSGLVYAGVEDVNISEMSTDEIIELRNSLNEELQERTKAYNDYIYSGKYIVGVDIAPGRYLFETSSGGFAKFAVFENKDSEIDEYSDEFVYVDANTPYNVVLEEGNLFIILNVDDATIPPYSPSWSAK